MENKRRRSRVSTHVTAFYLQKGAKVYPLVTQNISLKGMLAMPQPGISTGGLGVIRIELSSDAGIEIECQIIRSDKTGVAIDFMPMDEDSFFGRDCRPLVMTREESVDIDDETDLVVAAALLERRGRPAGA